MIKEFKLPVLGENVDKGQLSKILVAVGDIIQDGQSVIELETDKAVVEVPSSLSGKVTELRVESGKTVKVGDVILLIEVGADEKTAPEPPPPSPPQKTSAPPTAAQPQPPPPQPTPSTPSQPVRPKLVLASPTVRRRARELNINLDQIQGTGPAGRVTPDDVERFAAGEIEPATKPSLPQESASAPSAERVPMNTVRRKTAEHMVHAWKTIPHVTHHDKADITDLEKFRKQCSRKIEAAGGKLTVTVVLLKALALALREFPQFNATLDEESFDLLFNEHCNIGVAVDTDRGLLVPVIRDVDQKRLSDLALELSLAAEKARTKKLAIEDMRGGTFTLTNLGGIGGTSFTPIINAPEAAILGVARSRLEPVYVNGHFEPRMMLPLSLSYDHRIVDGADAARFLRWLIETLEQPFQLLLED